MMRRTSALAAVCLHAHLCAAAGAGDLKEKGAFGFDQRAARVLCDTPELRVSVLSDEEHLYVQAVLWTDNNDAPGETDDGRAIGDHGELLIDADGDGKATENVDREYSLNPWPDLAGLHYQIILDSNSSTGLKKDSQGRGAVSYVDDNGKRVRVDCFLVPLSELGRTAGETVRLAYCGDSTVPEMKVNSASFRCFFAKASCSATAVCPLRLPSIVWPKIGKGPSSSTTVQRPA